MSSKKIQTLVPKVKREAPSCPEALIIDELRNTLIEFCISTDIYLQDLGILQLIKNVNEYSDKDLDIPAGAELNHIIDIFKEFSDNNNKLLSQKRYTRIHPKAQIGGVSIYDFYGKGPVKYYTQKDQETLLFAPTPTENEKVYVLYSLKPTQSASTIPTIIANEYSETIVHGALYRLQMMKDTPFTDLQAADLNKKMYDKGEAQAVRKAKYGNVGAPLTIKYQEFV
tara:strand:+ start:1608 stop:2285 length:678 start_codon:yes stop_codon:yes gene_type:complete